VTPAVKNKIVYEYDFGDSWAHDLVVEKILEPEPGAHYPVGLAGKRACPPEDCGGVWGYQTLLEAIRDPKHPEHEEMLEWVGGNFDPEAFDLEVVNQDLQSMR
ncbi:MAG: plasmid pRiA4b ORF-3 family protein, partial [bacterium]